jgi:hypothetical protein
LKHSKYSTIYLAILMLIIGSTIAMANNHSVSASDNGVEVRFGKGKPGYDVIEEDILPLVTPTLRAQLDNVCADSLRIVVESCTDPTEYTILQILEKDPRFKNVDFHAMNLNWDGATRNAREACANRILGYLGIDVTTVIVDYYHFESGIVGDRYIKIYCAELLQHQKQKIIERTPVPVTNNNYEFKFNFGTTDTTRHYLSLSYMGGLRTTEFAVAPTAEITLNLNNEWALQLWGFHSTFLRTERDTFEPDTETFDQGWGIRLGARAYKSLWILGGFVHEENVLSDTELAGKRSWWNSAADLTISLRQDHYAIVVSGTYGHEWDFLNGLETTSNVRIAVVGGNTRRLK